MTENAETPRAESGAFHKDLTAGGPVAIVAQVQRRREAASRCEPLHCGHRDPLDCEAEGCGTEGYTPACTPDPEPTIDPGDCVKLWADARVLFFAKDFPEYASPAWCELHPDDPKRLAAALEAAECWRKYGDDVTQWFRDAFAPRTPLAESTAAAERAAAYQMPEPHQLQATPGWPPIAVPGQPGRRLTYTEARSAA